MVLGKVLFAHGVGWVIPTLFGVFTYAVVVLLFLKCTELMFDLDLI